jgi:hypothetical protein
MGRASSSKKVARAAGIGGGRAHRRQTPWAYYGILALILVLGVVGTISSRQNRNSKINTAGNTAPTVGTTWQEGYAVYECGKFVAPISTKAPDPQGITTRTAGVIEIKPTVKASAGKNATLGKFADAVGMKLNAAELQVPGGHLYLDDATCEGKQGHVYIKQFVGANDTVGVLFNGAKGQAPKLDPALVPLNNGYLLTIAFVPSSAAASIPAPPASVITSLNALEAQQTSTSTTLPSTAATLPSTATTLPSTATTLPSTATTQPSTSTTKPSTSTTKPAGA